MTIGTVLAELGGCVEEGRLDADSALYSIKIGCLCGTVHASLLVGVKNLAVGAIKTLELLIVEVPWDFAGYALGRIPEEVGGALALHVDYDLAAFTHLAVINR